MSVFPTWLFVIGLITVALVFINGIVFFTQRNLGFKLAVQNIGGDAAPHLGVTIASATLSNFFFTLPMTGAS